MKGNHPRGTPPTPGFYPLSALSLQNDSFPGLGWGIRVGSPGFHCPLLCPVSPWREYSLGKVHPPFPAIGLVIKRGTDKGAASESLLRWKEGEVSAIGKE